MADKTPAILSIWSILSIRIYTIHSALFIFTKKLLKPYQCVFWFISYLLKVSLFRSPSSLKSSNRAIKSWWRRLINSLIIMLWWLRQRSPWLASRISHLFLMVLIMFISILINFYTSHRLRLLSIIALLLIVRIMIGVLDSSTVRTLLYASCILIDHWLIAHTSCFTAIWS